MPLAIREAQLVVADVEDVAFVDPLVVDAHAAIVDAVGRTEIFDVESPVATNHSSVFSRNISVFDRKV